MTSRALDASTPAPPPLDPRSSIEDAMALHEAGHAVMGYRLGHTVELLTVESGTMPDGTAFAGRCVSYPPGRCDGHPPENAQEARIEALCYAAGWAAQLAANDTAEHLTLGQAMDFATIRELAAAWFPGTGAEVFLAEIQGEAAGIMQRPENRVAVESLAQMLLAIGTMDAEEIAATIEDTATN